MNTSITQALIDHWPILILLIIQYSLIRKDIQAIHTRIDSLSEMTNIRFDSLKGNFNELRGDFKDIKEDVNGMKGVVSSLKTNVNDLKENFNDRIDDLKDNISARINDLIDNVNNRIDDLKENVNDRISGVEQKQKTYNDKLDNLKAQANRIEGDLALPCAGTEDQNFASLYQGIYSAVYGKILEDIFHILPTALKAD
ncbi:MAG: hypothetical protein OXE78_14200 [Gammaproteobacteria bacterium]|nr:hypothetical protein [Gammaproteobacteria bacterium]